jgi:hypothetical protein
LHALSQVRLLRESLSQLQQLLLGSPGADPLLANVTGLSTSLAPRVQQWLVSQPCEGFLLWLPCAYRPIWGFEGYGQQQGHFAYTPSKALRAPMAVGSPRSKPTAGHLGPHSRGDEKSHTSRT